MRRAFRFSFVIPAFSANWRHQSIGNEPPTRRPKRGISKVSPQSSSRPPTQPPIHRRPCLGASVGDFECAASRHVIFLRHFFLINTNHAIVDHRPIRIGNRQWSSVAKIVPPRSGRRLPGGNPCVTPRAARLADRRLRILERLTSRLTVAHIASRAEGLSAQLTRRIIAEMLAIDPPAGFLVHSQIARITEARTGARARSR